MAKNRIQFQKGMSLSDFMARYGTDDNCPSVVSCVKYRNSYIRVNSIFWSGRDGKLHILTDTRCMTRH